MTESCTPTNVADLEARWDAVRRKLDANASVLANRGTLVAKVARGRRVWAVRFVTDEGGRQAHRTIYVGNDDAPDLIARTRLQLEEYRRARWAEEVEGYARIAARAGDVARRLASGRARPG